ncbi:hypothetical protein LTR56_004898 [Elasticomyces elasticus]|nr:hypothetical protein LTR56_004898 [Elasticomyces elasticus]KAK3664672.1 hypothetical protein LTR22_004540 [Elasticomyces elasticus]KAK4913739.1 hypothetical protein LTR49_017996 [Elasticomyces elasticus]KAK5747722.1 hypothetical protein LTS12_022219 [Elasticomyces elasticus]
MFSKHDAKGLNVTEIPGEHSLGNDDEKSTVPAKYRGTDADKDDMVVLGRVQVLRRNFNFPTMLGFASTVLVAWEILPVISVYALEDGGTAIIFWGLIAGIIGMTFVYASLAEMASMFPTAGGQYHWVSELAPPKMQKGLSYVVGWLTMMGWQVYLAGICFMVGSCIQGLIVLNNLDTYVFQAWHGTLLTIAVILFVSLFNTLLAARLPLIEGVLLILHMAGLFAIIIPLWVMAPRGNVRDTLFTFTTTGGWPNLGLASMIGMVNPIGVLVGEEVKDAGIVLPRALIWSVVPNGIMALIMGATFVFCIGDIDDVLASPTSFARDQGVPFSGWLSHVSPGWNIPIRAVFVSVVISTLLSFINIGSYVALNAINSLGVVSLLVSYTVTITCLVWRRLAGAPLPPRKWSLGRFGLAVNLIALAFVLPVLFFAFWPLAKDVTAAGFNWSSVMFVSILLIALLYYIFRARHVYVGPVMLVKRDL